MKKLMFLLSILAVGAFATACGDDNSTGQECGDGTVQMDGVCVPDPAEERTCGAGTVLDGNECVPENTVDPVECGPGTTLVNDTCEPNEECGEGTEPNMDGECIPTSMIMCGEGTIDDGEGNCVPENPLECGDGAIEQNGECVIDPDRIVTCGPETVAVNNECLTIPDALDTMTVETVVEQDDWRYEDMNGMPLGTENAVTLAAPGESVIWKGTIEPPTDINGDDVLDQDFDWFVFSATAGQVIEISVVNDGLPSPFFVVIPKDEDNEWVGRESATNQSTSPSRVIVIPEDGEYRVAMFDAGFVQGDGLFTQTQYVGSPDFGYFLTFETRADLTPTAGMAPTTINGDINEPDVNATTLTPSGAGEGFVIATSALDPAYNGTLLILDDMNQRLNELVLSPDFRVPIPVSMAGTTIVPDFVSADGYGQGPTVDVQLEAITPSVVPIDAPGEVIDNGGSAFFSTSVPANSLFELDFSLDAADPADSDVQALVEIYNSDLELLASGQTSDTEGTVSLSYFFAADDNVLIWIRDLTEEDPAGTDYSYSMTADIRGVDFLGTLDTNNTMTSGSTASLDGSAGDTALVGFQVVPGGVGLVNYTLTPTTATETVATDVWSLVDSVFERQDSFVGSAAGAAIDQDQVVFSDGYWIFEVSLDSTGTSTVDVTADLQAFSTSLMETSMPGGFITNGTPLNDSVTTTGTCTVGFVTVQVDINHTWIGDITMTLTSPDGTPVNLWDGEGGSADDIIGTFPIDLTPSEPLDAFVGENGVGTWNLDISDSFGGDDGTLNSWTLTVYCQ